jgi:thiol:disulfide interchange protein DsbD
VAVTLGYNNVYRDPKGYPAWHTLGLPVESSPAGMTGLSAAANEPEPPGPLYGWAMIWTLLGIFAGGVALNLTPCVYPLIPITVSYFGGGSGRRQGRVVAHGFFYLAGLCLTSSVLGVVAALTGSLLGGMLQNPAVLGAVAAILVFFATSLFGLWELRLPSALTQAASSSYAGHFGSLFMGLTMGVVAAPCIGPFVVGILTWVASVGNPWLGFLAFFTLSLGLGLPLFFLARQSTLSNLSCPRPVACFFWLGWVWPRGCTWAGSTELRPVFGLSVG